MGKPGLCTDGARSREASWTAAVICRFCSTGAHGKRQMTAAVQDASRIRLQNCLQRACRMFSSTLIFADWQGSPVHRLTTLPHPTLPVTPPDAHRTLTVAPLIADKRCYGEATVCIRRGSRVALGPGWTFLPAAADTSGGEIGFQPTTRVPRTARQTGMNRHSPVRCGTTMTPPNERKQSSMNTKADPKLLHSHPIAGSVF